MASNGVMPARMANHSTDSDSISIVVNGVDRVYSNPKVCSLHVLYHIEPNPTFAKISGATTSHRFIARMYAPSSKTIVQRSDDEIALDLAFSMAAGAGGELDTWALAGNVISVPNSIPIVGVLFQALGHVVNDSFFDQDSIDALAHRMLKRSGYNPQALDVVLDKCGSRCDKTWPVKRRELWKQLTQSSST
jgi:hypothetical protein